LQDLKIPVVAAINKIDLADEKQIESVSNSLREYEGFDNVPIVELSALTGKGVDSLKKELISIFEENGIAPLDVLAQLEGHATVLDLVNNQSGQHFLILMNTGKITVGDYFVCEFMQGRIRSIHDPLTFATKKEGLPGMAIRVQCTGINRKMDLPLGANFYITSKKKAENASIVRNLKKMLNERMIDSVPKRLNVPDSHSDGEDAFDSLYGNKVISEEVSGLIATLGDPEEQAAEGKNPLYDEIDPTTYLVIKANMGNTLSTLLDAVDDIKENGEDMSVLRSGVGAVGIGDVQNAQAAGCPIFAYNVPVDKRAKKLANKEKVEIIHSKTVQDVIDAIKSWKEKHALKLAGKLNDSDLALQEEFKDSDSESDEE
jgi:translation initiation factor IF-2